MRFPTKANCREWLATFKPDDIVGLRGRPSECPVARLIRYVIGDMRVRISVVPPLARLWDDPNKRRVAEARIPLWATCIIIGVDMTFPTPCGGGVTAGEVAALLDKH